QDPTAYPYQFQDDSYLAPRTSLEFVQTVTLQLEELSEEALKERINLRKVQAAVDMYDQLLQAGTAVSLETTHDLLDLICLYSDTEPVQDEEPQTKEVEGSAEDSKNKKWRGHWVSDLIKVTWKENNNAERIFNLLPERDTRCYSALIRGMVMHGASAKAFSMYTDLLNNRLTADVHIFNALISAAPDVREKYTERWAAIVELLNQMSQQKIQPNLLTFNSILKALKRCGSTGKAQVGHTLNEMKALGIAPSLATFNHILGVYFRPGSNGKGNIDILQDVMSELAGTSFTCQDPDDVMFFSSAMRICLDHKDLELSYKIQSLVEVGENWRLLGDSFQQSIYYGRFFNLLCMMEHIDVVLKWYRKLIPSLYYPNHQGMRDLLQALDTDSRLDLVPTIWKDIRTLGHDTKVRLVHEVLNLMAREIHSPEIQESFAACALDVKRVFEEDKWRTGLEWTTSALSSIATLLLRANKTEQAWDMLQLFKSKNRVPKDELLENFLSVCHSNGTPQRAVELVQLSAAFYLASTPRLATRALAEFQLTEEQ
ncbi:Pentatricopeptide repeat domain-containing protein 3, partial [Nibea albiflora]